MTSSEERFARRRRGAKTDGLPPVRAAARNAKLVSLPVAYAGRQAAGVGKRALGRPAAEVSGDIQLRTAQHMFEVLGELKGCAAKLGQLLSIYELALPPEIAAPYREALTQLQDSAPAMLPAAVHGAMAASMGTGWRAKFREFDDRHPAAASIGQVHRAIWHDGRPVAVKVQYPGAREAVRSDLRQLKRISMLAGVFLPGADVPAITQEMCDRISEELDYAKEAEFQRTFAAGYAGDPEFHVPEVVDQVGDVLITDWVTGTPLSKLIAYGAQAERDRVGTLILRFNLSGPQRCGLLYADPHPGNYRIMPDGRLGVIDFGACAELPPGFVDMVADILTTLLNGGLEDFAELVRKHGFVQPGRYFDELALAESVAPFREPLLEPAFRLTTRWLRKQVLRIADPRLSNVNRQLTMPAELTQPARMGLAGVGVLSQLNAAVPLRDELARWFPGFAETLARAPEIGSPLPDPQG